MSLLTTVFNFLGYGIYNSVAPTAANGQPTQLQLDSAGRLLVTVAAVAAGAPLLALPVTTAPGAGSFGIPTPTIVNGYQVSLPVNTSGGGFTAVMPSAPIRGMRVTVMDSGGFCATNNLLLEDGNGYPIQDPRNPGSLVSPYTFALSGFAATWEFVTGDPTNHSFWQAVRSLQ